MRVPNSPRWWPEPEDRTRSWPRWLGLVSLLVLATIGIFSILEHAWRYISSNMKAAGGSCSCGNTPAAAIARGCHFDVLAMAWLPSQCRDDELMDMFDEMQIEQKHTWTYYSYPNATEQLSAKDVSLLAGDPDSYPDKIVTTMDWHHSHCLYLIWKQARSSKTGVLMEGRYADEMHAEHCMKKVLEFIASRPDAGELLAVSQVDLYSD